MRRLACLLLLLGLVSSCGSAQRSGQCRVRYVQTQPPPPPNPAPASGGTAQVGAPPATLATQPSAPPPVVETTAATRTATEASGAEGPGEERDCVTEVPMPVTAVPTAQPSTPEQQPDAIDAQEALIRRAQAVLASGTAECRDVCLAAGNICTAASEICHLAGDGHARCGRARDACTDASRRRDGACPVCPSAR